MSAAFKMIMRKAIPNEDGTAPWEHVKGDAPKAKGEVVLAKYKKKARDLDEIKLKEDAEKKKVLLKEKQRLMGRRIPTKDDAESERNLAIIATKGVVQLFNAVAEFQNSVQKEIASEE